MKVYQTKYLHNRPSHIIKHCIKKIDLSKRIEQSCITEIGSRTYTVRNASRGNSNTYELSFGNDKILPYCECFEWKRTKLPCKHFFAVLENKLETWDSFLWKVY